MNKKKLAIMSGFWIGAVTIPHLLRVLTEDRESEFKGKLIRLHKTSEREIGTYIFPGALSASPIKYKMALKPRHYDLTFVDYGTKDYRPEAAARAVAKDIFTQGYESVQIISFSMGDQLLCTLSEELHEMIEDRTIEIVTIDSLPSPEFIDNGLRKTIEFFLPALKTFRTIGGWVTELPIIRTHGVNHSLAELIEQLTAINSYCFDYTRRYKLMRCVVAAIRDGYVFYEPDDTEELYDEAFGSDVYYYNSSGKLDCINEETKQVFKKVGFRF
jgi:hypothetical protein